MLNTTMISAQCPHSNAEIEIPYVEEVNIAKQPEAKEAILSGKFFKYTCPECGKVISTAGPLLYHDPDVPTMIYFVPTGFDASTDKLDEMLSLIQGMEGDKASLYQARLVSTVDKLLEKIYIQDAKLDDRIVELVKLAYLKHYGSELQAKGSIQATLFMPSQDGNDAQIIFMFEKTQDMATVDFSKDFYAYFATEYGERLAKEAEVNQFQVIDEKWAANFLTEKA